jgi:hypothetical protein
MPNDSRIIDRLRTENMVLRALVAELGGKPPAPSYLAAAPGAPPTLPTLAQLARRGL